MNNNNWDYYLARLENLDEKKTILPFEEYQITDRFRIYKDPNNAFRSVACISIGESNLSFEDIKKVEDLVRSFASFYSMESNIALDFYVPLQMFKNVEKENFGRFRTVSEETSQFAFPGDWQHNLTIEDRLNMRERLRGKGW